MIDAPGGEQRYSSDGMPTPRPLNPEPSRQGGKVVGVNMQMVAGVYPRRHPETDEKQDQYHKNYDRISNNGEQKQKSFNKSMIYSPLSGPYPDMEERTTQAMPKEEEQRGRGSQRKENHHNHEEKPRSGEENERERGHPDRRSRLLEESEDNHDKRRPGADQRDRQRHGFTPIRGPPRFFGFPKGFLPEGDQREEDRDRRGREDKDQREAEGEGRHSDRDGRFESHSRGKRIHEGLAFHYLNLNKIRRSTLQKWSVCFFLELKRTYFSDEHDKKKFNTFRRRSSGNELWSKQQRSG